MKLLSLATFIFAWVSSCISCLFFCAPFPKERYITGKGEVNNRWQNFTNKYSLQVFLGGMVAQFVGKVGAVAVCNSMLTLIKG